MVQALLIFLLIIGIIVFLSRKALASSTNAWHNLIFSLSKHFNYIKTRKRFRKFYRNLGATDDLLGDAAFMSAYELIQYIESPQFVSLCPRFLEENTSTFVLCRQYISYWNSDVVLPEFSSFVAQTPMEATKQLLMIRNHYFDCLELIYEKMENHSELAPIAEMIHARMKFEPAD